MGTYKKMSHMRIVCLIMMTASMVTLAQENKSTGFKFNNLTVSPFVNLEYTYDSNVDSDRNALKDSILRVNPGVDLSYKGNDWGLMGNGWFAYDKYVKYNTLDALSYGDTVSVYKETASGWRLVLGQSYLKDSQDDSIIDGGRGIWRNREQMSLNSALSYKVSDKTKVTLTGLYTDLNYVNDTKKYTAPLYGWSEEALGLEVARKITEKSSLLVNGGYQAYTSAGAGKGVNSDSTGCSLMAGLGSAATQKIFYHVLTGYTWFDYAGGNQMGGGDQMGGWTYSLDSSWVINKKWAATIAGSSYFQPSEDIQNQASKITMLSAGLTYRPARKLTTKLDIAGRREEDQISTAIDQPGTLDYFSVRTRADYELMRFASLYASVEYQTESSPDDNDTGFDKIRATLGVNLKY